MDKKTYYKVVSVIFAALAVMHALRVYYAWEAQVGGYDVPLWCSYAAIAIAGYLSVRGWQFAGKRK